MGAGLGGNVCICTVCVRKRFLLVVAGLERTETDWHLPKMGCSRIAAARRYEAL